MFIIPVNIQAQEMSFQPEIYVFINFQQAARFGHIGWAFRISPETYCWGSADHLWKHEWFDLLSWIKYMHVPKDGDIDWWSAEGTKEQMLQEMKSGRGHIRYHAFKRLETSSAKCQNALSQQKELASGGWDLLRHNCVHHAYLIGKAYDDNLLLPDPFKSPFDLIPLNWFRQLNAKEFTL